ncbi:hypothetical protein GCM10019016_107010 [Streptomyces prasinosporus]|uniref:Uncharacterized protein n=1 Tax=Streptomyces prasinosporus TaxID=68256 RepID=A0ABP6UBL6_9ACTN
MHRHTARRTLLVPFPALLLALLAAPPGTARSGAPPVKKLPYAGCLFAYFTGEGTADGEQIRYALSRGNDPLHWRGLNAGEPVLTSTIGERGLVRAAPDDAGNTWAPEAHWDDELDAYVVFWASGLHADDDPDHRLPASPRHGTVIPVTRAEHDRLLAAYRR